MQITPDFSEAAEVATEPIPDGVYSARITSADMKTSKKGDAYISWKLQIFGAEGDMSAQNNRALFYSTMTSGKGAGMLKALVRAATGDEPTGAFDTDHLLGSQVTIAVKTKLNPDGTQSPWSDIKSVKAYAPF